MPFLNTWLQKLGVPLIAIVLLLLAYRQFGWAGVAFAVGGIVMWVLLQFTRMMKVLQGASDAPVGYCDSAVMLNAKLKRGFSLLHVLAMTRALGEPLSEKGVDPEVFRWTDNSQSSVTCEFVGGKLAKWALVRPEAAPEAPGTTE